MSDEIHDQILESFNNMDMNAQEMNQDRVNVDTIASLNFRVNEYLDEIIKLKNMLTEKNMENDNLKKNGGSRRVDRDIDNAQIDFDQELGVKKTDEEILQEKLEQNFKTKINHVKINKHDARKS